jgi:hypothetical protein
MPSDHGLGTPRPAGRRAVHRRGCRQGQPLRGRSPGGSPRTNKMHANPARHDAKPLIAATGKTPERSAGHQSRRGPEGLALDLRCPNSAPCLPPFPMRRALSGSEYYGGSAPAPSRTGRRPTRPARRPHRMRGGGQDRDGSRVHCDSLDEGGARLGPCGIATVTPQRFTVASRPVVEHQARSSPPVTHGCAPLPAHIHQVRAGRALRDVNAGSLRTPFHPARRTRVIWQC